MKVDEGEMESVRVMIEVVAGVVPGKPEPEYTREYVLTSREWYALKSGDAQGAAMAEFVGRATGYATLLQLQPDRLNWVHLTWMWM
jgi:hypothetical protein